MKQNLVLAISFVVAALIISRTGVEAQQRQNAAMRDQQRMADLMQIHDAVEKFYKDNGFLPTTLAYSEQNPGGWDYSSIGGFLPFLETAKYLPKVPKDPINNGKGDVFYGGTGYSYAYFCYPGENTLSLGAKLETGKVYWIADHEKGFVCRDSLETAASLAKGIKDSGAVNIYGILFDTDKTDIKPGSKATLDEVAKLLQADQSLRLEVAGHTDSTGSAQHNMQLSNDRADAVVRALTGSYGISASRLQAKGYGASMPVAPNNTEDGRAKNRRVELRKI